MSAIFVPTSALVLLYMYMLSSFFSLNSCYAIGGFYYDEFSFFMVYLTSFVIFISFMISFPALCANLNTVLILILVISCVVFTTDNLFLLYFSYESSLIPIIYIIMKWGSYPERSTSSVMLLVYTSFFTFPFLYVIFSAYCDTGSLTYLVLSNNPKSSLIFSILVFLSFGVKLPIYGLHFWLPMAHVEAPSFGSMILAGVLLKLGGVGLVRFSCIMDISELKFYLEGYLLVFLVYSTMLCCLQSDFKRLVAYSSVSHMMTIPLMLMSSSFVSYKAMILVMFLHGVSSPLLFILVGVLYSFFSTRQHILMRGLVISSPLMSFIMVASFFFALSAPPFPSFLAEVFFCISAISMWLYSSVFLFLFLFLSLVYNLLWLTSIIFLKESYYTVAACSSISFSVFIPILVSLFMLPSVASILFFFTF